VAGDHPRKPMGNRIDLITVFEAAESVHSGAMAKAELAEIGDAACPTCVSCAGMFTADSKNCITEDIGMALSGNRTIPAVMAVRTRHAKRAGMQVMKLLQNNITPDRILTFQAFENALSVDMALGCSTNTVLNLTAIAAEARVNFDLAMINQVSARTPHRCSMRPGCALPHSGLNP